MVKHCRKVNIASEKPIKGRCDATDLDELLKNKIAALAPLRTDTLFSLRGSALHVNSLFDQMPVAKTTVIV